MSWWKVQAQQQDARWNVTETVKQLRSITGQYYLFFDDNLMPSVMRSVIESTANVSVRTVH